MMLFCIYCPALPVLLQLEVLSVMLRPAALCDAAASQFLTAAADLSHFYICYSLRLSHFRL